MARLKQAPGRTKRVLAFSEWLYGLFLRAYPTSFRDAYGSRMTQVFRDSCRNALRQHGLAFLIPFWLHTLSDLVSNAYLERWQILKEETRSMVNTRNLPPRLWMAIATTSVAFAVSLVASINLYLLEDSSHLTSVAYSTSPLLRLSYDGIYLSVLAASVTICAVVGYTLVKRTVLMITGLLVITLLFALGGFGGLLFRYPATFFILFAVFLILTLSSFLLGRGVAMHAFRTLGQRTAAVLGACVSVSSLLLINVVTLVLHTLLLNMVSHALYMQGQIGVTHLNFSLIAMSIAFLTLVVCVVSLSLALRFPSYQS